MAGPVPVATVLGCDPVSHRSCVVLVRGRAPSDTRIRGRNIHDYYFGEANTANKSDNHHNNAINENLNWGGFPGCYSSLPPTVDLVPRSRTVRGGGGRETEETTKNSTPPTRNTAPRRTTNFCREDSVERQRRRKTRSSRLQEEE